MKEDRAAHFVFPNSRCVLALFSRARSLAHTQTDCIRRLVEQSAGRIEIAAGGGVDEATVTELGMPLFALHFCICEIDDTSSCRICLCLYRHSGISKLHLLGLYNACHLDLVISDPMIDIPISQFAPPVSARCTHPRASAPPTRPTAACDSAAPASLWAAKRPTRPRPSTSARTRARAA